MKKVAIIGATGYTGQELLRLLLQHTEVQVSKVVSQKSHGTPIADIYPSLSHMTDLVCCNDSLEDIAKQVDLIFLALPHEQAAGRINESILKDCLCIDLSADFRLRDAESYDQWYHFTHPNRSLLAQAVYGLPELKREEIRQARLVANPGCYSTCSILTLAPLLRAGVIEPESIVIDAKSGASGAGRSVSLGMHFDEVDESIKAYSVTTHRHTPEIEQELSALAGSPLRLTFTPHLVPMNRGILVTAYASCKRPLSHAELTEIYEQSYKQEYFIRLFNQTNSHYKFPETRWVKGSNFCDIGYAFDARTQRVVAVGALDNLVKGAAGQAIQNMNLLFGWDEALGLRQASIFPA